MFICNIKGLRTMLEVKNLTKAFGKRVVLNRLSVTLTPHVYGLLGQNGSGKTTLIRCLTHLYKEGEVTVFIDGACSGNVFDYLDNVGYLPQRFGLYPELSVNATLELLANLKGIDKQHAHPEIERVLALVNLSDRGNDRVGSLSGGMVRRLGIAQALLGDPPILFFDEPTAGLDPEERLRFKNLIADIKGQRIIVISTHIVEDVEATCDRILILHNQGILVNGTNDDIRHIARGKVYDISESDLDRLSGDYNIFKKYDRVGEVRFRILANTPQQLTPCEPEIEDGYLCTIKSV